jgi:hypothetical protein
VFLKMAEELGAGNLESKIEIDILVNIRVDRRLDSLGR